MTPEESAFLDGFVARVAAMSDPRPRQAEQALAFLDEFAALVGRSQSVNGSHASGADLDVFRRVVMAPWTDLVATCRAAIDTDLAALRPSQRALLRVVEESPSLLGPLRRSRDEVMNTGLFTWFLQRPGDVGRECRRGFLRALKRDDLPADDWQVTRECVLGPGCRLDVEVVIPGKAVIFVEAKIDAEERLRQLADYGKHLDEVGKRERVDVELVFLTIDGREGATNVRHKGVSWADLVREFLPATHYEGATSAYLASWLVTLAVDLCDLAQEGPISSWRFSRRRRMLDLLKNVEVSDA